MEEKLNALQTEILKAMTDMAEKQMFTEAVLAKKVRENARITGAKKAGIAIGDLEKVVLYMEENGLALYSLHLNSANDLLIKKDEKVSLLDAEAKKRRLSSQKSMSILSSGDLGSANKGSKDRKTRKGSGSDRKSIRIYDDFENTDY